MSRKGSQISLFAEWPRQQQIPISRLLNATLEAELNGAALASQSALAPDVTPKLRPTSGAATGYRTVAKCGAFLGPL